MSSTELVETLYDTTEHLEKALMKRIEGVEEALTTVNLNTLLDYVVGDLMKNTGGEVTEELTMLKLSRECVEETMAGIDNCQ